MICCFNLFQNDLGLNCDLFGMLDEPSLNDDGFTHDLFDKHFPLNTPTTESLLWSMTDNDKAAQNQDNQMSRGTQSTQIQHIDHDYTPHRPSSTGGEGSVSGLSDSGISTTSPLPPSPSDTIDNASSQGQISPAIANSPQDSPLGGGIEEMDINQCLLQSDDLLNILTTDTNVSINLGEFRFHRFANNIQFSVQEKDGNTRLK